MLDRAPAAGGLLLGVLSYKPQLWVLVPLALVAGRQWRALGWTIGTAGALALLSAAVVGPDLWLAFLDAVREAGLSPAASGAVQLVASALAVAAVWIAFRRHAASDARLAVLATATFLVSPYTLNYDLLLLMPAVVAMFRLGVARGFYPFETVVHLAVWLSPALGWALNRLGCR